ncbi:LEAF RUST 10 DISEASE-RESISTANCE LOCUS RECEPTOR-LIKE PROTEIN KINASE-like 1.5 [Linum perenne]
MFGIGDFGPGWGFQIQTAEIGCGGGGSHSDVLAPPLVFHLEASTNRFDPKRKNGDGGFVSVYLGQRILAVKYLHKQHRNATKTISVKSFFNEILIISSIDHLNLMKLHGYCSDPRGLLLVHDYVPNGY